MFKLFYPEPVNISSNWKKTYSKEDIQLQTDSYKIIHRGFNVKKFRDKDCQTDEYLYVEEDIKAETDENELFDFVNEVTPKFIQTLKNNEVSKKFKLSKLEKMENDVNKCVHHISKSVNESSDTTNISGISWNSSGTVLALSYGEMNHDQWCTHTQTGVAIYRMSTLSKESNRPESFFDTTSCTCSVAFHGSIPAVLSAGTQNGEILVWNRAQAENKLLIATSIENLIHEDEVVSINWFKTSQSTSNLKFLSMSKDGIVVVWNVSLRKQALTPIISYKLTTKDLPKSVQYYHQYSIPKQSHSSKSVTKNLSVVCAAVNYKDNEYFAAGTDTGIVFLCKVNTKDSSSFDVEGRHFKSPVDQVLVSSLGFIHSICWSKTVSTMLVVATAIGKIYVFNSDNKRQLFSVESGLTCLYNADISNLLHGMIVSGGNSNSVVLTDILGSSLFEVPGEQKEADDGESFTSTNYVLKMSDKNNDDSVVTTVAFNCVKSNYVACANSGGDVFIWELGREYLTKDDKNRLIWLKELFA